MEPEGADHGPNLRWTQYYAHAQLAEENMAFGGASYLGRMRDLFVVPRLQRATLGRHVREAYLVICTSSNAWFRNLSFIVMIAQVGRPFADSDFSFYWAVSLMDPHGSNLVESISWVGYRHEWFYGLLRSFADDPSLPRTSH
jgi:hypothetical protein